MDIAHWYESAIADRDHGFEFRFAVIPARSIRVVDVPHFQEPTLGALDVSPVCELHSSADFAFALFGLLVDDSPEEVRRTVEWCRTHPGQLPDGAGILPQGHFANPGPAYDFAFDVLEAEVVPFERSPLAAESLAKCQRACNNPHLWASKIPSLIALSTRRRNDDRTENHL